MANPFVLFENLFDKSTATFTVTAGGEAAGFEKENALDWRMNMKSRWRASGTGTNIELRVDLGAGNEIEADTMVIGGHNLGTIGALYDVDHSADGAAWTGIDAPIAFSSDFPELYTFTIIAGARRYWRVNITAQPFSAAPEIGVLTLGRRLDFEGGANISLDPYGFNVNAERTSNNNGSPLGVNIISHPQTFGIEYGGANDPGFTTTGFWDASSGLNVDDDFTPHVKLGKPFWFSWNSAVDTRAWLCWANGWSNNFVGTTTRRGWSAKFNAYREVS